MKEDLAEWLQLLYPYLNIQVENFMEKLETGVVLCEVFIRLSFILIGLVGIRHYNYN